MKAAAVVAVVVLGIAAAWLWMRDRPVPSATPGGSFTDVSPPRDAVPMPDVKVPASAAVPQDQGSSGTGTIRFPDGDEVEIRWREPEMPAFELTGNATTDYIPLRLATEAGDGLAAWILYNNLRGCASAFRTEEELGAAIDQLQQTHTVPMPESGQTARIGDPLEIPRMIEGMQAHFESCRGISDRQIAEKDLILQLGAEAGNSGAAVELGQNQEDPLQAKPWYALGWQNGSSGALLLLAESYRASYDQGLDPDDKLRWYAALYVHTRLLELAHGGETGVAGRWARRNRLQLDEATKEMLPRELDAAIDIAKEMLRSNPNCCPRM